MRQANSRTVAANLPALAPWSSIAATVKQILTMGTQCGADLCLEVGSTMTARSAAYSRGNRRILSGTAIAALAAAMIFSGPTSAQEVSANTMWGTNYGGVAVSGASASAQSHGQNAIIAGQVNAAERGYLVSTGSSGTIQAIGSQTIVSSTIYGNSNSASINATQTSTNSGAVSNTGTLY
jgi:hypothetical protein